MTQNELRSELANFLRTRRSHLLPGEVGLLHVARRKTAGLRREEFAQLTGVGVTWYTWLEQGRGFCQNSNPILAGRSHLWYADLSILTERGTLTHELPSLYCNWHQGTSKENQAWLRRVFLFKLPAYFQRTNWGFQHFYPPHSPLRKLQYSHKML